MHILAEMLVENKQESTRHTGTAEADKTHAAGTSFAVFSSEEPFHGYG
jgi:hypothetical protein